MLQEEYEKICERNYKESQKACESKIECIFAPLEEKIRDGSYMTPGGYKEYCNDLKLATSEYRSEGGRGVKVCWGGGAISGYYVIIMFCGCWSKEL